MKNYRIAAIPGDGTGPEVIAEGIKVVNAAAKKFGFGVEFTSYDWGGNRYLREGAGMPDDAAEVLKKYDAIYLGAIGCPEVPPGILEKSILLKLRFELDQYINLRPVKLYPGVESPLANKKPEDIDYVVVRENSGDVYTGEFQNNMMNGWGTYKWAAGRVYEGLFKNGVIVRVDNGV